MNFVYHTVSALHGGDHVSYIRLLDLACGEEPQEDLKKFHFLRNALSHNKKSLKKSTIEGIKTGFGDDYLVLLEDKFDFASSKNLRNLHMEAQDFLNRVRSDLNKELENKEKIIRMERSNAHFLNFTFNYTDGLLPYIV